jgi:hypothetical protein
VALVKVELEDPSEASRVLKEDYCDKLKKITKYLITLKRPKDIVVGISCPASGVVTW